MKTLKIFSAFIFVFLTIVISQSVLSSNEPQGAAVTITVRELMSGTYIDGATVRLCGDGGTYTEVSAGGGIAYFPDVREGEYCVDGITPNYMGLDGITVSSSGNNFTLYVSAAEIPMCGNCE